jgi:transposase
MKKHIVSPSIFNGKLMRYTYQHKPKWELRKIGEVICYLTKTGCQWRLLPIVYAPWQTVY